MSRLHWRAPVFAFALLSTFAISRASALEECRLLRQPDIQGTTIVFAYAGDLWKVARSGGTASRLTTHEGQERFPKLSPDGQTVAFTGEYDGNVDAYTIPVEGGEPKRLTWHPASDQVAEWYPDGKSILIRSPRASAPQRYDRFFKVPAQGGFEEMLALPTGGYASFSPDGRQLAFVSPSYDGRTWKRYKGGNAADIWVYDFAKNTSEKITDWEGSDEWPMWHERTIYYCSDQGGRTANIWAYDLDKKSRRQVTTYSDYDVKWPSVGSDAVVFEKGGYLFVMDLPSEKVTRIQVLVPDDKPATRPEYRNVANWIEDWSLSPSAKRAVFSARGDIFTLPAEKGDVRDLTQSPGSHQRGAAWSPDGKSIAYFSDQSGAFQIHVCGGDGKSADRQITHGIKAYPFELRWSPDSKKIAFSDKTRTLYWCDAADGAIHRVDRSETEEIHRYAWASDSRWIAYARAYPNQLHRVLIHSLESGQSTPISDGMNDDDSPAFDPEGKYLYFISSRTFNPVYAGLEFNFQFPYADGIYAVTLRDSLPSPVAPQSDEEAPDAGAGAAAPTGKTASGQTDKSAPPAPPTPVRIDLSDIGSRVTVLPMPAGRYSGLSAFKNKVVYVSQATPGTGEEPNTHASIHFFDLEKREDKTVLSGVSPAYSISKDGAKLLYKSGDKYGIVEVADGKKVGDGKLEAGTLMALVDPRQEWNEMFDEALRLESDFYYDPNMGGLDWKAVGDHYRSLIPYVADRTDLNYILGELIGELSTSHTYVSGGDVPAVARVGGGLLGADFSLDVASGLYRFQQIYAERDWNSKIHAPLGEPGVRVKEGDYLLSVNGQPVKAPENVYAAFVGTADKLITVTVGSSPRDAAPRTYTVKPVAEEGSLRYTSWVRANREKVAQATGGRVAYLHVPSTAGSGVQEFGKQYYPQVDKDALIVDERFNSGGFIPNFFVDLLGAKTVSYATGREGDFRTPATAIDGPKCIMANQYAGSGGDAFPFYFKQAGLGPIIGKRTWGGLVGISHGITLMDGGRVTMPEFGIWGLNSTWTAENHGVDPDIEVENTPESMAAGRDLQLERAIQYCMDELRAHPARKPARPAYKVQVEKP